MAAKYLVLTSSGKHSLTAKVSHGQLFGLGPVVENMLLKVQHDITKRTDMFKVTLQHWVILQPELVNTDLALGQVEFRWEVSHHTIGRLDAYEVACLPKEVVLHACPQCLEISGYIQVFLFWKVQKLLKARDQMLCMV